MNPENQTPPTSTQTPTPEVTITETTPEQKPITSTPTVPPIKPEVPKAKSKILPVLIFLLVLVGFGSGGYFLYTGGYLNQFINPKSSESPIPTQSTNTQPTNDPTSDWKTYKNQEYGFEVKYPNDYYYQENYDTRNYGNNLRKEFNVILSYEDNKGLGQISYIVIDILKGNEEKLNLLKIFQSSSIEVDSYKEEKFINLNAISYTNLVENPRGPQDYTKGIFFERNNYYLNVYVNRGNSEQTVTVETYDQILSTFKFLDQGKDTTANWITYQVPKTEYSKAFTLYYPSTWKLESKQAPIRLSKDSIFFEFRQGAGSVGDCLFNDDKDNPNAPEFASIFPSYYKEIKKSEQMTWRLATMENPRSWDDTFILCQKLASQTFYTQYTSIGYVPFRVPQSDTNSLNEIIEILTRIKIIE